MHDFEESCAHHASWTPANTIMTLFGISRLILNRLEQTRYVSICVFYECSDGIITFGVETCLCSFFSVCFGKKIELSVGMSRHLFGSDCCTIGFFRLYLPILFYIYWYSIMALIESWNICPWLVFVSMVLWFLFAMEFFMVYFSFFSLYQRFFFACDYCIIWYMIRGFHSCFDQF